LTREECCVCEGTGKVTIQKVLEQIENEAIIRAEVRGNHYLLDLVRILKAQLEGAGPRIELAPVELSKSIIEETLKWKAEEERNNP
jgi:hypothetical protein